MWTVAEHGRLIQDGSGKLEREEFLAIPQISSNPLATR